MMYDNVDTTSYCLRGKMADGTYVQRRAAASNSLPLGTKIRLTGRAGPGGIRLYRIRDRIGSGTSLDLWTSSCRTAIRFGRRSYSFKIGWFK